MPRKLRRRRLLQLGAAAALAGPTLSCSRKDSPWRFLTAAEARTLTALSERIIPADQDPGAAGAGVVEFIDRQLAGFYKPHRKLYREGLAELARAGFAGLPEDQQIALMATVEKTPFFGAVVAHTMQGYYGSPRHGGNRDGVSWRMLGVPVVPVRGRAHYDLREKG